MGVEPTEVGRWPETAEGLSAGVIKSAIEGSLRRLGTDHVELYWAHMPQVDGSAGEVEAGQNQLPTDDHADQSDHGGHGGHESPRADVVTTGGDGGVRGRQYDKQVIVAEWDANDRRVFGTTVYKVRSYDEPTTAAALKQTCSSASTTVMPGGQCAEHRP